MPESNGDSHEGGSVPPPLGWTCHQFSISLGDDEVAELLRRVADTIERIDGFRLLDVVVDTCVDDEEAVATVYYRVDGGGAGDD